MEQREEVLPPPLLNFHIKDEKKGKNNQQQGFAGGHPLVSIYDNPSDMSFDVIRT